MSRSRASRTRELQRELRRPKAGRPHGSHTSLLDNTRRFALAVWRALDGLGLDHPYDLSALVTVLIEEREPITIESIDSFLVAVSSRYPTISMTQFNSRIDRLVRDARALPEKIKKSDEVEWLAVSTGCVHGAIVFAADGNLTGVRRALEMLRSAGWGVIIDRVQARIATALRGNVPPFDESGLGPRGRRLVGLLRERENAK
jgi:hypothetical protein